MTCWYCYYGWPKAIYDIYKSAKNELLELGYGAGILHYSFSHIVWEDENFDKYSINYCISIVDKTNAYWNDGRYSELEKLIALSSLVNLLSLPDEYFDLDDEWQEAEGDDIENYPPPIDMDWVKPLDIDTY